MLINYIHRNHGEAKLIKEEISLCSTTYFKMTYSEILLCANTLLIKNSTCLSYELLERLKKILLNTKLA